MSRTRSKVPPRPVHATGRDPRFNIALARGLAILEAFGDDDEMLGNKDLAARSGLPQATVSRLTFTLADLGYLVYVERLGKYMVSARVLALGAAIRQRIDLDFAARSHMQTLAKETNGIVGLGLLERDHVIILDSVANNPATARLMPRSRAVGGLQATSIQLLTPATMRGRAMALYLLAVTLLGMGLGPLLVGVLNDHVFGSLRLALASVSTSALGLSATILWLGRHSVRRSILASRTLPTLPIA